MSAPGLALGPLLRRVEPTVATVWVETDAPCEVTVLDHAARTVTVAGHHVALVVVTGLTPGVPTSYEVHLDGRRAWPLPGQPPSVIRPPAAGPLRLAFGSCRVATASSVGAGLPSRRRDPRIADALIGLARRMVAEPASPRPDLLVLLGDQVYGDKLSAGTRAFVAGRRPHPRGASRREVADFEEYARLYREAWQEPHVRWLLSTVPSAMLLDDHELVDDWNISAAWLAEARRKPWWAERVRGGLMSYWLYQHLGNMEAELARDHVEWLRRAEDPAAALAQLVQRAHRTGPQDARWSHVRELGAARLVLVDSRDARVVADDRRDILSDHDWAWLRAQLAAPPRHLLVATSLPWLLPGGLHHLEAWTTALCERPSRVARIAGEWLRRALDQEHWAAFPDSFARLGELLGEVGSGPDAPASMLVLSGDVHYGYHAQATLPGVGVHSPLLQLTSSPLAYPVSGPVRTWLRVAATSTATRAGRALSRRAGHGRPPVRWEDRWGPWFGSQLATLALEGDRVDLTVEKAVRDPHDSSRLIPVHGARLVPGAAHDASHRPARAGY